MVYVYLRTGICLEPSTSFFPQVLESTSGFRFQLLYNATRVAKNYDWNQAPGCQREPPQIKEKTPQIEEKFPFRLNCLAAGAAKQKQTLN